jgi:DNA repair ATPase RecN
MKNLEKVLVQALTDRAFAEKLRQADYDVAKDFNLSGQEAEVLNALCQLGQGEGLSIMMGASAEAMRQLLPDVVKSMASATAVSPKVDRVEPKLGKVSPKLDRVEPKLGKVSPKLDRVEPKLGKVSPKLDRVEPKLGKVSPKLDRVEPKLEKVQAKVSKVEAKLSQLEKGKDK